jgi:signal transduction histidine kinase
LAAISSELRRLETESENLLLSDLSEVQEMIRNRLQPVITRVTTQLAKADRASVNLVSAAAELQATCDRDVRELSHRLSEPVWSDRNRSRFAALPRWRSILKEGALKADTYHYSVLGIALYLLVFLALAQSKYTLFGNILFLMAQGFALAFILDFGFWRRVSWKNTYLQVAVFYAVLLSAFSWLILRDPEFLKDPDFRAQMFTNVPLTFLIIWVVVSFLRAFEFLEAATKAEIEISKDIVENTQKAYEQRRNQVRRGLASLLHGKIQGRLAAVSLAMVSSANQDDSMPIDMLEEAEVQLRKVQSELEDLLEFDLSIVVREDDLNSFSVEKLTAIISEWGGLLEVTHNFDETKADFVNSHYLAEAIEVSIQESLSNAVRHGKARKAKIEFDVQPFQAVLTISNNGLALGELSPKDGHGGREILALSGSRSFKVIDGETAVVISWELADTRLFSQ